MRRVLAVPDPELLMNSVCESPGMSRFKGSALATSAVFRYDARVQCVRATAAAGGSIHQSTARGR